MIEEGPALHLIKGNKHNNTVISVNVKRDLLSSFNHLSLICGNSYVHRNKTIEISNEEGNIC
jgi:hypothetical protein